MRKGKYIYLTISDYGNRVGEGKGKQIICSIWDLCETLVLRDKEPGAALQGLGHCIAIIPSQPAPLLLVGTGEMKEANPLFFSNKVPPVPLMGMP